MGALIAFFLSPIGRLIGVGLIASVLAGGATFWLTSQGYKATISQMKADEAKAEAARSNAILAKYQAYAAQISAAAQTYVATQGALDTKIGDIQKGLKSVIAKTPLPRGCKPTADRVRVLTTAVSAANSAAGPSSGPTVPATNGTH
jgi:hypothetical protein